MHTIRLPILAFALGTTALGASDSRAASCPEGMAARHYIATLKQQVSNQDEVATLALAAHYMKGTCLPKDSEKGRRLYEKLANNNNAEAEFRLGIIYLNGYGVAENHIIAEDMFQRAHEHGHSQAKGFMEFLDQVGFDDC